MIDGLGTPLKAPTFMSDWGSIPHISTYGDALAFDGVSVIWLNANNIVSFERAAVAA